MPFRPRKNDRDILNYFAAWKWYCNLCPEWDHSSYCVWTLIVRCFVLWQQLLIPLFNISNRIGVKRIIDSRVFVCFLLRSNYHIVSTLSAVLFTMCLTRTLPCFKQAANSSAKGRLAATLLTKLLSKQTCILLGNCLAWIYATPYWMSQTFFWGCVNFYSLFINRATAGKDMKAYNNFACSEETHNHWCAFCSLWVLEDDVG